MPDTVKLADWPQLTADGADPDLPTPIKSVEHWCLEADEDDDGDFYDVDFEALTAAWLDRIRERIAGHFGAFGDNWVTLTDDGDLHAEPAEDAEIVRGFVRAAIRDIDPVAMSSMYHRRLTTGVVEIVTVDDELDLPFRTYEFGGDDKLRTAAEVVAEAKGKYRAEFELGDHVELEHSFNPHGVRRAAIAEAQRKAEARRVTVHMNLDVTSLLHKTAVNEDGVEFHIDRFELETLTGHVVIVLSVLDEDGCIDRDEEPIVVDNLSGWLISQ